MYPGRDFRKEEQETATKAAEEHGGTQCGTGAPADPIREGAALLKEVLHGCYCLFIQKVTFNLMQQGEDVRMQEIMKLAHEFLQNFCAGNQQNQALLHKHINLFLNPGVSTADTFSDIQFFKKKSTVVFNHGFVALSQILEATTMQHIFMNNFQLCSEINERVVQHFVHCTETHGRHVQYLKFLQTIVKAENKSIKKGQDIVMAEVKRRFGLANISKKTGNIFHKFTGVLRLHPPDGELR